MKHVFVTNTDSPFGLGLIQHYAQHGASVFAACPYPDTADEFQQMSRRYPKAITLVQLDPINREHMAAAFDLVRSRTSVLDVLINNAEMNRKLFLDSLENASYAFRMNAIAPILLARRFTPLLLSSACPRIINIASGEPVTHDSHQPYTYNTGRQALKLYTQALASELKIEGIHVLMMELGCMQAALISADEEIPRSVIAKTVARITSEIDIMSTSTHDRPRAGH